jgi:hypothetical protein
MSDFDAFEFELPESDTFAPFGEWQINDNNFTAVEDLYDDISWLNGVVNEPKGYTTPEPQRSTSPKKNLENTVQLRKEAVTRCYCKKSRCVRLYCECRGAGLLCQDACRCTGCENRTPSTDETHPQKTKARDRCNCKKTRCLKKYCECFAGGNKCGDKCKCTGCQNTEDAAVCYPSKKMKLNFD